MSGSTDIEVVAVDGRIELTLADVPARVEDDAGFPVIVAERPMKTMSAEDTRAALERVRR